MSAVVTPVQVERRLKDLSGELDTCHDDLVQAEQTYFATKAQYEVALAKSRLTLSSKSSPTGKNYTVGEREDMAIVENADLHFSMASAEAFVRAARANAVRLKTQVDIARSISVSVRTGMDL
jgi:hypothetical protein